MNHTEAPTLHGRPVPDWYKSLQVRLLRPGESERWRQLMSEHHYLGFRTLVGPSAKYVATIGDEWVALLGWSVAAWQVKPRDQWLGWSPPLRYRRLGHVANNSRFLILPEVRIPNLASAVLSATTRRLSADWLLLHGRPLLLAETFVDPKRFSGTLYRAAGWIPLGLTRGFARKSKHYHRHGQPKMLWVRPLVSDVRERLADPFASPAPPGGGKMSAATLRNLNWTGPNGLRERLEALGDPRHRRGIRHGWVTILLLAIAATLAGQRGFLSISDWVGDLPQDLRARFGCRGAGGSYQVPSEPTIRRTLQTVDADKVDAVIGAWLSEQGLSGAIAVDGKTLRGSDHSGTPVHLLSAILHQEGVVIAQQTVGEKTNEIPALLELLEPLDLEDRVVTADALHTQVKTAQFLVDQKHGHYVFEVKGNQPQLYADIATLELEAFSPSVPNHRQGPRTD